jgi:imidazolonepropionase-like amidohydrolase
MRLRILLSLAIGLVVTALSAQPHSTSFVVRNVRVFDGERVSNRRTVVVVDGKIMTIGNGNLTAPPDAELFDGNGRTLLPGLIDAHVHVSPVFPREALQQSLAFGVTTVIDMWTGPPPRGSRAHLHRCV